MEQTEAAPLVPIGTVDVFDRVQKSATPKSAISNRSVVPADFADSAPSFHSVLPLGSRKFPI